MPYLNTAAGEIVPVLSKLKLRHEDLRGSGGTAPTFLALALVGCEW
jgi:hypothetical protein